MELNSMQGARVTRGSKLSIGAQVVAVVVLAFACAVMLTWLTARPGLRGRVDLTASKLNTLDPALAGLLDKVDKRIDIDVFFQPEAAPLTNVAAETQRRMRELLFVARGQFPSKFRTFDHDMSDVAGVQARMKELGLSESNVVVVALDGKRVVLRLLKDLARVNPGNPVVRQEPSIEAFLGESALANAILRVTIQQSPKVWFTTGHGERDLYDVETVGGLGRLHTSLTADGFVAERWESRALPHISDDVRVVAVMDARQPFSPEEVEAIDAFVASGGRLLVAASSDDRAARANGSIERLLERYGVRVEPGVVARPVANSFGERIEGRRDCAVIIVAGSLIDPRHPITESLWRGDRGAMIPNSRPLSRDDANAPSNAAIVDVLRSPPTSWRDLPNSKGEYDYRLDPNSEGDIGSSALAFAVNFRPSKPRSTDPEEAERERSRVFAIGSADAFANGAIEANRDFILNVFNWLSEREDRLRIAARLDDRREIKDPAAMRKLTYASMFGLPLLCAALGVLLGWRRRK